jgi:uncharacterized membrane protein HdeD (DUF308 family)
MVGGLVLLATEAVIIRPMFVEGRSTVDVAASFMAIQFASFVAFTAIVNGLRFWRLPRRTTAQDRWGMILMGLIAFAMCVLVAAWIT